MNDIFLGSLNNFHKIDARSAAAASLRYFSLGSIETREIFEQMPILVNPNDEEPSQTIGLWADSPANLEFEVFSELCLVEI